MTGMERVFIDTSGWVALFVGNDTNHANAVKIYESLKDAKAQLYTSDYVIDETITTILVRGSHRQAIAAGNAILASKVVKIIAINQQYFVSAWKLFQKYEDKKFSFTDVTSFAVAADMNIKKAFSYDSDFAQVGIELCRP